MNLAIEWLNYEKQNIITRYTIDGWYMMLNRISGRVWWLDHRNDLNRSPIMIGIIGGDSKQGFYAILKTLYTQSPLGSRKDGTNRHSNRVSAMRLILNAWLKHIKYNGGKWRDPSGGSLTPWIPLV